MESEIYCAWFETIEEYSACDLTVEGDKLIAISAIAKVLQWGLFDRYLAGIFQGQLAVGLLWRAVGQRRSQPTRYGPFNSDIPWLAPSWSWASVKGAVAWDTEVNPRILTSQPRLTCLFNLLDAGSTSVGPDLTGNLSDAWLKLEAAPFLFDVRLDIGTSSASNTSTEGGLNDCTGFRERPMYFKIGDSWHRAKAEFDELTIITMLTESINLAARRIPEVSGSYVSIPSIPLIATRFEQGRFKIQGLMLHLYGRRPNHPTGFERIGRFTYISEDQTVLRFFESSYSTRKREIMLL
jgi:hypothetical protein